MWVAFDTLARQFVTPPPHSHSWHLDLQRCICNIGVDMFAVAGPTLCLNPPASALSHPFSPLLLGGFPLLK